jgi:hypothetical protein
VTVAEWTALGDDVARAVGVVVAQAGCSSADALALLLAAAEASGRSVEQTAVSVIDRRLRFDRPKPGSMLQRRVSAHCVEVGVGDAALNAAGDRASGAREPARGSRERAIEKPGPARLRSTTKDAFEQYSTIVPCVPPGAIHGTKVAIKTCRSRRACDPSITPPG